MAGFVGCLEKIRALFVEHAVHFPEGAVCNKAAAKVSQHTV
jgi:hypothetical protein